MTSESVLLMSLNLIPLHAPASYLRYGLALLTVVVVTAIAMALHQLVPHANPSLVFLLGVLAVAVRAGTRPALLASLLSFLSFNYLFISPHFTFVVHDDGDVANLLFFLLMAIFAGHMAARIRSETQRNRAMIVQLRDLNRYTQKLAAAVDDASVEEAMSEQLSSHQNVGQESSQAQWQQTVKELAEVTRRRITLVDDLEQARIRHDTEQLRSALLSSVSHDLRTPLASIIGSASSLLEYGDSFSRSDSRALLRNVLSEAERLNRYIQNLLDMTRLGQGELTPQCEWVEVADLVSSAVERLDSGLGQRRLTVEIDPKVPLIHVQGVLIEQCLVNVLDNAIRYTRRNGQIRICAGISGRRLHIDIQDDGPGIAPAERDKIFEMFYSARHADRLPGSGLGLAICKGLAEAHGGTVRALEPMAGRGALIRIELPCEQGGQGA